MGFEYLMVRDFHPDMWPALKMDGWQLKRQFTAREDCWPFDRYTVTEFRRPPAPPSGQKEESE